MTTSNINSVRPRARSDHREESKSLFLLLKKECGGMISMPVLLVNPIQTVQDVWCESDAWTCTSTLADIVRGVKKKQQLSSRISHIFNKRKRSVEERSDAMFAVLIPQIKGENKRTQCLQTWTPASPVWTGCLSWESAACARGESEDARARGTEKKTEGGRGETLSPWCLTPPPPPPAPKANLRTATPRSSPWQ